MPPCAWQALRELPDPRPREASELEVPLPIETSPPRGDFACSSNAVAAQGCVGVSINDGAA